MCLYVNAHAVMSRAYLQITDLPSYVREAAGIIRHVSKN